MSKQKTEPKKFNRDSELRIRNFDPKLKAELQEIMKLHKLPFESYAVAHLIRNYRTDQSLIKQLQARNSQLHATCAKLVNREEAVLKAIVFFTAHVEQNQRDFDKLFKMSLIEWKGLAKQFKKSGTVTATGGQSRKVASRSSVPKKGGKK
jgi:hypothetical protein